MPELTIPLSPLIVQVAASWCQPCKRVHPLAETAANELDVAFQHVLIEEYPEVEKDYEIASVPTFLVFNHGRLAGKVVGALPPQQLSERFEALIDG